MKIRTILSLCITIIMLLSLGNGQGKALAIPQASLGSGFTYQGYLRNNAGIPLTSTCNFNFNLYDAETNGTQFGTASVVNGVSVSSGYFTTLVNSSGEFGTSAFTGEARWLEITVQCTGDPGPSTLSPRQALTLAPYASFAPTAGNSDMVDGQHASAFASSSHGHWGAGWSGSGTGLTLQGGSTGLVAVGSMYGVDGSSSTTTGIGLSGRALANTGVNYGVYGYSASREGAGVYGRNNGPAVPSNNDGAGVYGVAVEAYIPGVLGEGYYGVKGVGLKYGVYGIATSSDPANSYAGYFSNTYGYGGYFESTYGTGALIDSYSGTGAKIESYNGIGLIVRSDTSGDILQVSDYGSNILFRVNGQGNVHADGGYHCGNDIDDRAGDLDELEIEPCLYDESPADFAEMLPTTQSSHPLEPGDVLVIGSDGQLTLSNQPYQSSVAGVYSTNPSYLGNGRMAGVDGYAPLAIAGVVPVKVCDENGSIQPGDLLTTSSLAGYAMKASPVSVMGFTFYPSGVILGKALESLQISNGVILVLVILQ
jgi:hypothetical protein